MAAPTKTAIKPGRTLTILGLILASLMAWAFWPGLSHSPRLGLDLRGGTQVILSPVSTNGVPVTDDQLKQSVEIIRQRVDGFGVAESEVTTQGSGENATIIVSIPGTTNKAILDSLSTTAKLDFRPVINEDYGSPQAKPSVSPSPSGSAAPSTKPAPVASSTVSIAPKASASPQASSNGAAVTGGLRPAADTPSPTPSPSSSPVTTSVNTPSGLTSNNGLPPIQSATNDAALKAAFAKLDCSKTGATKGGAADPTKYLVTCSTDGQLKYLLEPAAVQGTEISSAQAGIAQGGAGWEVNLGFSSAGAQQFADTTTKLSKQQPPQNQFAITLDGLVQSAPRVNEPILGGSAVITGNFTPDDAKALANVLKYGSLPVTLVPSSVEQISPTLGEDQLRAGILAGLLGLLLVVVYLVIYYRALGLVAVASLLVAAAITYSLFVILGRQLGFTLSLAGVAGAIVAIGITADSFIVYFERIRDEIREGRSLRAAGDAGWIRARKTILAADFVSLLAAVVLYFMSVGSVRGFAFTLGLTTLVDIFVAFLFTRPLVSLLMRTDWFTSGKPWTGLSPDRLGVKTEVVPVGRQSVVAASAAKES